MARINWEKLKGEYLLGDYKSLKQFAESKGMNYNGTFRKRASGWNKEKRQNEDKKATKIVEKTTERQIQHEVDRNTAHLQAWDALLGIVVEVLTDKETHLSTKAGARNVYALEKLSAIIDRVQKGQRLAEGMDMEKPQQVDVKRYLDALNTTAAEVWDDEE